QLVDGQFVARAGVLEMDDFRVITPLDPDDGGAAQKRHALARQRLRDPGGSVGLFVDQDARRDFQDGHFGAKAAQRLCQLTAHRSGADYGYPRRHRGEREDGLVGQIAGLREPRDRERDRASSRRDYGAAEADGLIPDGDRIRPREAALTMKNVDPEGGEARGRIVAAQVGAQAAHPLHHGGEIDGDVGWRRRTDSHARRVVTGSGGPSGGEQGLGWYTAVVQAVPAHQTAFDQRDLRAETGRARRGDQSRRAGPDHDQIVARCCRGLRIPPRIDVREQPLVVPVVRIKLDRRRTQCHAGLSWQAVGWRTPRSAKYYRAEWKPCPSMS